MLTINDAACSWRVTRNIVRRLNGVIASSNPTDWPWSAFMACCSAAQLADDFDQLDHPAPRIHDMLARCGQTLPSPLSPIRGTNGMGQEHRVTGPWSTAVDHAKLNEPAPIKSRSRDHVRTGDVDLTGLGRNHPGPPHRSADADLPNGSPMQVKARDQGPQQSKQRPEHVRLADRLSARLTTCLTGRAVSARCDGAIGPQANVSSHRITRTEAIGDSQPGGLASAMVS